MTKKCIICNQEAFWYGQQMEGVNLPLTFTRPGYHYRGFAIHPVCDRCWQFGWKWTAKEWANAVKNINLVKWYHNDEGQYKHIGLHCEQTTGPHGALAVLQCTRCQEVTFLYQGVLDNLAVENTPI